MAKSNRLCACGCEGYTSDSRRAYIAGHRQTEEIFHTKYEKGEPNECWEWRKTKGKNKYGEFKYKGKRRGSHVVALMFHLKRDLKPGLHCLHTCNNKSCVNPNHLKEGTHQENMQMMIEDGLRKDGEHHHNSKLTEEIVIDIRKLRKTNRRKYTFPYLQKYVKKKYGVCVSEDTIRLAIRGERWKSIGGSVTSERGVTEEIVRKIRRLRKLNKKKYTYTFIQKVIQRKYQISIGKSTIRDIIKYYIWRWVTD